MSPPLLSPLIPIPFAPDTFPASQTVSFPVASWWVGRALVQWRASWGIAAFDGAKTQVLAELKEVSAREKGCLRSQASRSPPSSLSSLPPPLVYTPPFPPSLRSPLTAVLPQDPVCLLRLLPSTLFPTYSLAA